MTLAALCLVVLVTSAVDDAVEIESRVREWALELWSGETPNELRVEGEWVAQAAALDSLARAVRVGSTVPESLRRDAEAAQRHAHPNVRAAAFELAALAPELDVAWPAALPDWPVERAALVACSWRANVAFEDLLARLADEDERVRAAARGALVRRDPTLEQIEVAFTVVDDTLALARALRFAAYPEGRASGSFELEATTLARGGAVAEAHGFVARYVAEPAGRERLLLAAARGRSPELAEALFDALVAGSERAELHEAWALAEASEARLVRLVEAEVGLLRHQLALLETSNWPAGAARWLTSDEDPELRRDVTDAVARGFAIAASDSTRALLEIALLDPATEAIALRALAARARESLEPLVAAWRRLDEPEALVRLAWFDDTPLEPLLDELLELGEHPDLRRNFVVEHLARLGTHARVGAALERWFDRDLARFAQQDFDVIERPRPAVEARLLATAKALVRFRKVGARLEEALRLAATRSDDLAKHLVVVLGRHDRERLRPFLEESFRTRTRVEAAIALASTKRATRVLRELQGELALDLRLRAVAALSEDDSEATRATLNEVARESSASSTVRLAAVSALAKLDANSELEQLAREVDSVEVQRRVFDCLGSASDAGALERLRSDFEDDADWLAARARVAPLDDELRRRVLEGPLADFEHALAAKHAGQRLGSPEFVWRAEIATLTALLARREIDALLRAVPWWAVDSALLGQIVGGPIFSAAASIGTDGEGGSERRIVRTRVSLAVAAVKGDDATRAARIVDALRAAFASGALPRSGLSDCFGGYDVDGDRDSEAVFAALVYFAKRRATGSTFPEPPSARDRGLVELFREHAPTQAGQAR